MKRTIKLRESELKRMIAESVKRVLRESDFDDFEYNTTSYDVSGYDDKKMMIFSCLINGDEEFTRTLLDELSDSAINEIFNIAREMGWNN